MIVAITGTIGSGKTTVLKLFEELGATILSADEIVHELLGQEPVKAKITDLFGKDVLDKDGDIDKKKLAEIIFSDEHSRKALEALIHPLVVKEINKVKMLTTNAPLVVEVPLLFEADLDSHFDKVITVGADKQIAKKRVLKRGISADDFEKRLSCQMSDEKKRELSDFFIDNSDSIENTREQVKRIWQQIKGS